MDGSSYVAIIAIIASLITVYLNNRHVAGQNKNHWGHTRAMIGEERIYADKERAVREIEVYLNLTENQTSKYFLSVHFEREGRPLEAEPRTELVAQLTTYISGAMHCRTIVDRLGLADTLDETLNRIAEYASDLTYCLGEPSKAMPDEVQFASDIAQVRSSLAEFLAS